MKKSFDNAIELFSVNDEELEKINKYSLTELNSEDVFTFSVCLCDNEIDRDNDRFSVNSLHKLAELFVGKTGISDHNMKSENQVARIYSADVETLENKTSVGEAYTRLKAKAYMLKNDKNKPLIDDICAGIKKEVSVNCAIGEIICSKCGKDVTRSRCEHVKGRDSHHILNNPTDAYEWSFVAVPAQKNAGTVKNFLEDENDKIKYLEEIAKKYKSFLKKEIVKLTQTVTPEMSIKSVSNICESLSIEALENLREDYMKAERKKFTPQLIKEEAKTSNDNFKI